MNQEVRNLHKHVTTLAAIDLNNLEIDGLNIPDTVFLDALAVCEKILSDKTIIDVLDPKSSKENGRLLFLGLAYLMLLDIDAFCMPYDIRVHKSAWWNPGLTFIAYASFLGMIKPNTKTIEASEYIHTNVILSTKIWIEHNGAEFRRYIN